MKILGRVIINMLLFGLLLGMLLLPATSMGMVQVDTRGQEVLAKQDFNQ
jgi:hypothetical protein